MEDACTNCYNLVLHNKSHPALKKISELKGSELYKCCCCYAYLHKHNSEWEIISGGDFTGDPDAAREASNSMTNHSTASEQEHPSESLSMTGTDQVYFR